MDTPLLMDERARHKIRTILLGYMQEHAIGVPSLADRIRNALPRKQEIPIKTLQRFLAGLHRTNDSYVVLFKHFADAIKPAGPTTELGEALAAFFEASGAAFVAGTYETVNHYSDKKDQYFKVKSVTQFTNADKFSRVDEVSLGTPKYDYEGVAVENDQRLSVLLRDKLTKLPKQYSVRTQGGDMRGNGTLIRLSGEPRNFSFFSKRKYNG